MISVHLRPAGDDGAIGEAVGSAFVRDARVIYEGSAETIRSVLALLQRRLRLDEVRALSRLAVDGWSNGKMVIAAD